MFLYLSIAAVLFGLAFLRAIGSVSAYYERVLVVCLTIPAFVMSFVRWETGTDWAGYIGMFERITSLEDAHNQSWWEPGYSYTAALVNSMGQDYTVFLLCIAVILFSTKLHILTKSCAAPLVAVFVLFCCNFYDLYFVRQDVAVVFFWAFAYYFYNRRYATAAGAGLLAVLFHYSAVVPIALVVTLARADWKRAVLLALFAVGAAYFVASRLTLQDVASVAGVTSYVGTNYIEEKASDLSTTLRAYLKLGFLVFIVAMGYLFFAARSQRQQDEAWTAFCLKCAALILLMTAALLPVSEIFARFPSYAIPLLAVALSNYKLDAATLRVGGVCYLIALALLFVELGFLFSSYADAYYPIKTLF
jgi:hypothetical protein